MSAKRRVTSLAWIVLGTPIFGFGGTSHAQPTGEEWTEIPTEKTINSLRIERLVSRSDEDLDEEYAWAKTMVERVLTEWVGEINPNYAVEFQKHVGRIGRFRGDIEQALDEYYYALELVDELARRAPTEEAATERRLWGAVILRDIADTYLTLGDLDSAEGIVREISQSYYQRPLDEQPEQLKRLAEIANRRGDTASAVQFCEQAVRYDDATLVARFLGNHASLTHVDATRSWAELVRRDDVRSVLQSPDVKAHENLPALRERYCHLARAYRRDGRLGDAEYALETAKLTPWAVRSSYREQLDLFVEHERAALLLARGEYAEALAGIDRCLDRRRPDAFALAAGEEIELLDLAARALEGLGRLDEALQRIETAVAIVEQRREALRLDEYKQKYLPRYAELYRRAADLVVRIHEENGGASARTGNGNHVSESFRWSERAKARAMLDTLRRSAPRFGEVSDARQRKTEGAFVDERGRTGAVSAGGEPRGLKSAARMGRRVGGDRGLGEVLSIDDLQSAPWWRDELALVEYSLAQETTLVWVVTKERATVHRLRCSAANIKQQATALRRALSDSGSLSDAWVAPARWLYRQLIEPVEDRLTGADRLVIIGDGELREIPFGPLVVANNVFTKRGTKHQLLIDRYVISYAPSATLLDRLCRRATPEKWEFDLWAFASSQFHSPDPSAPIADHRSPASKLRGEELGDLPALSYAGDEVQQIAKLFRAESVRLHVDQPNGKQELQQASRGGRLGSVRFLHFATHAIRAPAQPYLSGLVLTPPYPDDVARKKASKTDSPPPTPGEQSGKPAIAAWKTSKPDRPALLTVQEIAELDLGCEVVVLSACHTVGSQPIEGDWLNGLTRAFLVAGSSGVLCTTWKVSDLLTAGFSPTVYRALLIDASGRLTSHSDAPWALREVKQAYLSSPSPSYSHPSRWAHWVYHGALPFAPGE